MSRGQSSNTVWLQFAVEAKVQTQCVYSLLWRPKFKHSVVTGCCRGQSSNTVCLQFAVEAKVQTQCGYRLL